MDDREPLDRLVNELNSSARSLDRRATMLDDWLAELRRESGSDLYLVAGLPPSIRARCRRGWNR